jgi:ubiquitin C-terminal hydrolase
VVIGVKGLTNHGNTCFFNSVKQAMSQTAPLLQYYIAPLMLGDKQANKEPGPLAGSLRQLLIVCFFFTF